MHQRCCHCYMKKGHFVVHVSPRRISRCPLGLRLVGSLSGVVGTCREELGMWILWNLTLRESQIVVNKILAEFPIPEILRSVPAASLTTET